MTKPADLKIGDQIKVSDQGWIEVIAEPYTGDSGPEGAAKFGIDYRPEDDRITVDVRLDPKIDAWELAAEVGARDAEWLAMTPFIRYRLWFHPTADVEVKS